MFLVNRLKRNNDTDGHCVLVAKQYTVTLFGYFHFSLIKWKTIICTCKTHGSVLLEIMIKDSLVTSSSSSAAAAATAPS